MRRPHSKKHKRAILRGITAFWADPGKRAQESEKRKRIHRKNWEDPEFRKKALARLKPDAEKIGRASKERWASPVYRKRVRAWTKDPKKWAARNLQASKTLREKWQDPHFRSKVTLGRLRAEKEKSRKVTEFQFNARSLKMKDLWLTKAYREKTVRSMKRSHRNNWMLRLRKAQASSARWRNPEFRERMISKMKDRWAQLKADPKRMEDWKEKQKHHGPSIFYNDPVHRKEARIKTTLAFIKKVHPQVTDKEKTRLLKDRLKWQDLKKARLKLVARKKKRKRKRIPICLSTDSISEKKRKAAKCRWDKPGARGKAARKHKKLWSNPEFRERRLQQIKSAEFRTKQRQVALRRTRPHLTEVEVNQLLREIEWQNANKTKELQKSMQQKQKRKGARAASK